MREDLSETRRKIPFYRYCFISNHAASGGKNFPSNFRGDFLFNDVKLKLKIMKRFLALSTGRPMSRRFAGVQMKPFMMRDATQTYFL